jgi:hypothetical protein
MKECKRRSVLIESRSFWIKIWHLTAMLTCYFVVLCAELFGVKGGICVREARVMTTYVRTAVPLMYLVDGTSLVV